VRRLALVREALTELTADELDAVVGADGTILTGVYPTIPYRACLSAYVNCTG
jgi:hypothetical protein